MLDLGRRGIALFGPTALEQTCNAEDGKPNCSKSDFLESVMHYKLDLFRDSSRADRLIRLSESADKWVELATWRDKLLIGSHCGTYCFVKSMDMFDLFRSEDGGLNIYPEKWAEYLTASPHNTTGKVQYGSQGHLFEFCRKQYADAVYQSFCQYFATGSGRTEPDDAKWLDPEVEQVLLGDHVTSWDTAERAMVRWWGAYHAYQEIIDLPAEKLLTFRKATYSYEWTCYAIVWAIAQFERQQPASNNK